MSKTIETELAEALAMTGLTTPAELIDMANVGQSLMERIADLVKQEGPFKGWMPADDPAEIVVDLVNHYEDAALSRALEAEDNRFWLILHEPGRIPDMKGPWDGKAQARVLREFMTARPTAYIDVLSVSETGPLVQHGPEVLQMLDGRSMARGRRHNAQTRKAHAPHHAALSEAVADWVMVPREPTREMWAAMGDAFYGHRNRHHDAVAKAFWKAALSASPGEPDAVGKPCTLAACPPGLFLAMGAYNTLGMKSEYHTDKGAVEAYIVESGEFFWGDNPQTVERQRAQIVRPVSHAAVAALVGPGPSERAVT